MDLFIESIANLPSPSLCWPGVGQGRFAVQGSVPCDVETDGGCKYPAIRDRYLCTVCQKKYVHDLCWQEVPGAEASGVQRVCSVQCVQQSVEPFRQAKKARVSVAQEPCLPPIPDEKPDTAKRQRTSEGKHTDDVPAGGSSLVAAPSKKRRIGRRKKVAVGDNEEDNEGGQELVELDIDPQERRRDSRTNLGEGVQELEYRKLRSGCLFTAYNSLKDMLKLEDKPLASGTARWNKRYHNLLSLAALHGDKMDVRKFNNRPPIILQTRAFVRDRVDFLKTDFVLNEMSPAVVVIIDEADSEWKSGATEEQVAAAVRVRDEWAAGNVEPLVQQFEGIGATCNVLAFTLVGNHSTCALSELCDAGSAMEPLRTAFLFFISQLFRDEFTFIAKYENDLAAQRAEGTALYNDFALTKNVVPFIRRIWEHFGCPDVVAGGASAKAESKYINFKRHVDR